MTKEELMAAVKYDDKGLVPVICQDVHSKKVRMLAYMNQESLRQTLETGKMTYWSRSRQAFWVKGETSGNFQYLKGLAIDCDGDTLLAIIEQVNGISCHTGHATCFYREIEGLSYTINRTLNDANNTSIFKGLEDTIEERRQHPKEGSYTNYLIDKGLDKICKKVGEESTEAIIAAKNVESDNNPKTHQELIGEIADVMYHLSVMMNQTHVTWEDVETELKNRHQ